MEETPVVSAPQALEELRSCYEAFVEKLKKSRAASMGEVVGFLFRAQGNPKVNYTVEEFNALVPQRVSALTAALKELPPEEAGALAGQALELMLFYPKPRNSDVAFPLAAFEGHALPLAAFLTPAARQETARRYAKRNPPRQMLPNQKKLWQALSAA